MSGDAFDWHEFLGRWQQEWVPRAGEDEEDGRVLGRPGAGEAAIAMAEERLGRRLPPSYREFLAVSNGWHVGQPAGIYELGGTVEIDWFRDPYDMATMYEESLGDDPREEEVLRAGMWRRALRLETDSDMSNALLDPGDSDQDGEWALWVYKGWGGEYPDRYPSFRAYMEAMYRSFHADRRDEPGFVNATTRAQDAHVAEARLLALRGRYEEALPRLEEALSFGRPDSFVLLQQLRHLSAPHDTQNYGNLVADPRYLPEILPLEAMAPARARWREDGDDRWLTMMTARGVDREAAGAVLGALLDGTHRYEPPGPWGRAVAEARETARWGATDAAWRVLRAGLLLWGPPGPELIAPVGLLADSVLGPLITPERGREILATPRAGETGSVPEPSPDLDPPGLAWLTEPPVNGEPLDGYRCVWVEASDPARLTSLIGEEGAELSAPVDPRMQPWRTPQPHEREGVEYWEDRVPVAVGRTVEGWAFAFDGHARHPLGERFVSPAVSASSSGRAVVVWRERAPWTPDGRPAAFHLSVAERGEELYAFTVRGAEIQRSGEIPEALDPERLFGATGIEPGSERDVLDGLHTELGLSLPRFALTQGRLSTFTTRSWSRPPREGEAVVYARFVRTGPEPGAGSHLPRRS